MTTATSRLLLAPACACWCAWAARARSRYSWAHWWPRLRPRFGAFTARTVPRQAPGRACEARALVHQAVALIDAEGLDTAVRCFHDRGGRFIDRDLFITVLDRKGYCRAFGMDPSKANKPSVAAPGVNLQELKRQTCATADAGGGWFEFRGQQPITELPADKMAYVLPTGPECMVLCSINKNDGR